MGDRITIINNDNGTVDVMVNGDNIEGIATNKLEKNIHAVQWYEDHGVVEYDNRNEEITDLSPFLGILDDYNEAVDRLVSKAIEEEPTPEELDLQQREILLLNTDWIVIKYMDIDEPIPQDWKEYRQKLRDITKQEGFPGNVDWPEEPETTP